MSRGLNKVMLIGNLGADPEIRHTNGGMAVATLRLATAESWKDRETGESKDRTEWHRVVFFGRTAEVIEQYLNKGSQIYVEGRLQTRKWQDKDGNDRYTTEIVGGTMQMLGSRRNFESESQENSEELEPRQSAKTLDKPQGNDPDWIEDDIPF